MNKYLLNKLQKNSNIKIPESAKIDYKENKPSPVSFLSSNVWLQLSGKIQQQNLSSITRQLTMRRA